MDSKIIAAIIIGLAMIASVYLYNQDSAYKRCLEAKIEFFSHLKTQKEREETAKFECQFEQVKFIK